MLRYNQKETNKPLKKERKKIMKTMFKVETRVYTDCEGRNSEWKSSEFVATMAEAEAIASQTSHEFPESGDYRIVAMTMDEATFTFTEEILKNFDYWREVERPQEARKNIERYRKEIEKLEASKARCKTELGIAKKEKDIITYLRWIEQENRWI